MRVFAVGHRFVVGELVETREHPGACVVLARGRWRARDDVLDARTLRAFTKDRAGGVLVMRGSAGALAQAQAHPLFTPWLTMVTSGHPVPVDLGACLFGANVVVEARAEVVLYPPGEFMVRQWERDRAQVRARH